MASHSDESSHKHSVSCRAVTPCSATLYSLTAIGSNQKVSHSNALSVIGGCITTVVSSQSALIEPKKNQISQAAHQSTRTETEPDQYEIIELK
eukprot:822541-Amphidinium_carterae.1